MRERQGVDHLATDRLRRSAGIFQGRIESEEGFVGVSISPDGQPVDTVLAFAERVVDNIDALSERGRELAAAEALETYNADWRFGEIPAEAGVMAMSEGPIKSKAEFFACLVLFMVRITGHRAVTLTFACGDSFSRHAVCVTSSDGLGFDNARVELQEACPDTLGHGPGWWRPINLHQEPPPAPRSLTAHQRALKRSMDIVGALAFFVLLGPLYLLVAGAVRIGMGGPVHCWQMRLGQGGRPFRCYKFRSMETGADEIFVHHLAHQTIARARWGGFQKLDDDPRVKPVARMVRRLRLDELPQFYNVLKGDMSLVGPRACMVRQRSLYGSSWDHYCHMRPGITGLWQVIVRNHLPYADRVALDARYVTQWSLALDARILLRTVWVVLGGDGSS